MAALCFNAELSIKKKDIVYKCLKYLLSFFIDSFLTLGLVLLSGF